MIRRFIGLGGPNFRDKWQNLTIYDFFCNQNTQGWDHVAYWTLMLAQSSFHIRAALRIIGGKVATKENKNRGKESPPRRT